MKEKRNRNRNNYEAELLSAQTVVARDEFSGVRLSGPPQPRAGRAPRARTAPTADLRGFAGWARSVWLRMHQPAKRAVYHTGRVRSSGWPVGGFPVARRVGVDGSWRRCLHGEYDS